MGELCHGGARLEALDELFFMAPSDFISLAFFATQTKTQGSLHKSSYEWLYLNGVEACKCIFSLSLKSRWGQRSKVYGLIAMQKSMFLANFIIFFCHFLWIFILLIIPKTGSLITLSISKDDTFLASTRSGKFFSTCSTRVSRTGSPLSRTWNVSGSGILSY